MNPVHDNAPVRVSVVVPCFNHGKYIPEMLQSVLDQTYPFLEIIIVNDGSTDDTATILNRIRSKKVTVFHTANHGPAHARNLAITHARGDLIVNLDADDKIAPDFLRRCTEIMDAHPEAGIVYSNVQLFGAINEPFNIPDYTFEGMLRSNCIVANACFRKSDWEKTEGYAISLTNGYEDFDFWLSIIELGRKVRKIEEPLVFYRRYQALGESRSGRRKVDPLVMGSAIVQVFRRHRNLYKKSPEVYEEFLSMEKSFAAAIHEHPAFNPEPVFSIITPVKNPPAFLKRNIDSVLRQSFTDWEHIIVDGANNEETALLVKSYNDPRIKYITHSKLQGASGAYNTGMIHSAGKFINFLDDDHEYLPEMLRKLKPAFEQAKNDPGFILTAGFSITAEGLKASTAAGKVLALSIKRECLKKTGLFDDSLPVGYDTDYMMRLSQHYSFLSVSEALVKIQYHRVEGPADKQNMPPGEFSVNFTGGNHDRGTVKSGIFRFKRLITSIAEKITGKSSREGAPHSPPYR